MNCDSDEDILLNLSESEEENSEFSDSESLFSEESSDEDDNIESIRMWQEECNGPTLAPPRFPFSPLKHRNYVTDDGDALDYFSLYFNDELISIIVEETNRYSAQQNARSFSYTNTSEIRVFLALVMLQGIVVKPTYFHFWSKKPILETPFFGKCMSLKRFLDIKRFLHFSNNEQFDAQMHPCPKLNKIWPIYAHLSNKFKAFYTLPRDVTIDESLMLYKGRLGWIQYIPLKRARFGIKLYMLCDSKSGYVWSSIIYTGKGTVISEVYKDLPVSSQVVLTLMHPLLGKGYCLTTDNFYTSPQLADLLIQHKTDTYGTVKLTRKEMPKQLKAKKLKKGETIAYRRGKIVTMKWKDKRDVTLLSTVHTSCMIYHERSREVVCIPQIVKDYNNTMGGVDRVDQTLSSYPIMRKRGKKYYKKLFFHLLELSVWNAFILYKSNGHTRKPLEFRMDLVDLLIAKYKEPELKTKGRPGTCDTPLRLSGRHFPEIVPPTPKRICTLRVCAVCSKRRNADGKRVRRESRYQCRECGVGLCVTPCFRDYHTKTDLS